MEYSKSDMERLFQELNDELSRMGVAGELYLVGGAVMCLVFDARPSTKDIDAFFRPARQVREAAQAVAASSGLPSNWLNDAVKGYLSDKGDFHPYLESSNLRVLTAAPEYLLAMKCLAMRLGEVFHDEEDVRFLLRYLNLTDYQAALDIVTGYYPLERLPRKTLYALEELLAGQG
ncbi:MAG: DUF6036 family nucleotidyltransferase [Deltaproteobacteria bacterium]|nr:DUF6036 family nucleotidyltransferase [Deltaproteobacteria bacterium]